MSLKQKLTLKKAVEAKCFDCGYDELDRGSKHQQIELCQDVDCALHEHRPVTGKLKRERKEERIKLMTEEEREKYFGNIEMLKKSRLKSGISIH